MNNIRKSITALFVSGILIYFLIKTNDLLTRIVIIPFLVFSISFFIEKILLILNKKSLAKKISKIYEIAFFVYWFGFLIYCDYISIKNKDFTMVLFSLIFWIGGGYFVYKRFFRKKDEKKRRI